MDSVRYRRSWIMSECDLFCLSDVSSEYYGEPMCSVGDVRRVLSIHAERK